MSEPAATPSPSPWRFAVRRLVRHKLPFGLALFWSVVFVLVPMQVPVITGALLDNLKSKHVRLYGFDLSPGSRRRSIEIAALALMAVAAAGGGVLRGHTRPVADHPPSAEKRSARADPGAPYPLEIHHHREGTDRRRRDHTKPRGLRAGVGPRGSASGPARAGGIASVELCGQAISRDLGPDLDWLCAGLDLGRAAGARRQNDDR